MSPPGVDGCIIAIVDDDSSVLRSVRRLLQSVGYAVATFASGGEFLEAWPRMRTACLILDVHLGGMNGFEVQERLAADGAGVPIIFISAYDDTLTRERIRRSGAAGHLWKPFDDEALLDAIRAATGQDHDPVRPPPVS